jgi:hypothetical protein
MFVGDVMARACAHQAEITIACIALCYICESACLTWWASVYFVQPRPHLGESSTPESSLYAGLKYRAFGVSGRVHDHRTLSFVCWQHLCG